MEMGKHFKVGQLPSLGECHNSQVVSSIDPGYNHVTPKKEFLEFETPGHPDESVTVK